MKLIRSTAVHEKIKEIHKKHNVTATIAGQEIENDLIQGISDIPAINLSEVILKDKIDDMTKEIESKTKYYEGLLIEINAKIGAYKEILKTIEKYTEEGIEEWQ